MAPIRLFAGEDVDATPPWVRNHWLLAALVASFQVDLMVALIIGGRRLAPALEMTELPIPGPTAAVIAVGAFLHVWWPLVVVPLLGAPLLVAWRFRHRAAWVLQVWFLALAVLLAAVCIAILLPIKTIATATG